MRRRSFVVVDVVIPVFWALRDFDFCLQSLKTWSTSAPFEVQVIVVDDSADEGHHARLVELIQQRIDSMSTVIRQRPTNGGFLPTAEEGFSLGAGEFVILLNTDVLLSRSAITEMVSIARTDKSVALVSPLTCGATGPGLDVRLPPGWSFVAAQRAVSSTEVDRYIDVTTAIGHCLLVRRSAVEGPLFDPLFGKGYGEESDLHYRLRSAGYRSVLAKRAVVTHTGGRSFGAVAGIEKHRERNLALFLDRWGERYASDVRAFLSSDPLADVDTLLWTGPRPTADLIVFDPDDDAARSMLASGTDIEVLSMAPARNSGYTTTSTEIRNDRIRRFGLR